MSLVLGACSNAGNEVRTTSDIGKLTASPDEWAACAEKY
jgi:hypothetical protein